MVGLCHEKSQILFGTKFVKTFIAVRLKKKNSLKQTLKHLVQLINNFIGKKIQIHLIYAAFIALILALCIPKLNVHMEEDIQS